MSKTREQHVKTAKRIKFIIRFLKKRAKIGKERFIDTPSHGKIRVLEYGFDDKTVRPLFVDMHGSGFVLTSADSDEAMCVYFQEQTKAKVITIDYPKAPEKPYPIAVEAVYEVIQHYTANADKYGIDTANIGVGGHSAGGNLATVTCIRAKERGDLKLKYQILDYPPLDLHTDPFLKPTPKKAINPKMATMFNACYIDAEKAKEPYASPVFATQEQLVSLPPTLLIVAGLDSLHNEAVKYGEMLKAVGVDVELHDFPNATHGFTLNKSDDSTKAHKIMADYIAKHSILKE